MRHCCRINEATKETKGATIVGRKIIYVMSAPFYDEKTKRSAVLKGDLADIAVIAERGVTARTNAGSNTLS